MLLSVFGYAFIFGWPYAVGRDRPAHG